MTSISSSALDSLYSKTEASTTKASDTYNQFLVLLTTQLQNQDPLSPMESDKFTSQLVSFSQVEQNILTNQKLDAMLTQSANNLISQSLGYIGKDVYYRGNTAYYDGETPETKFAFAIDGDSKTSKLQITDKDGTVVRTIAMKPGETTGSIIWDGKDNEGIQVKEGNYTLTLAAFDAANKKLDGYTAIPGHVQGIESIEGILYLALKGDSRIDSTAVLSISEPDDIALLPEDDETDTTDTTDTTDNG